MITQMQASSSLPGAPDLPIGGFVPNNEAIQIRNIDGLGPVKADISSTPLATGRGEFFQGGDIGKRNILLTLGLNPNWVDQSMMSLRQLLYRYFMTDNWATYTFFSDELPTVNIRGVVESFEPNIFSNDPEVQISIICPFPDFIDVDTTTITGVTRTPTGDPHLVEYAGTVSTGFVLQIDNSSSHPSYDGPIEIMNDVGPYSQDFNVSDITINSDRSFKLTTIRTRRDVRTIGSSGPINVLHKTDKSSTWPEFSPGENTLMIITSPSGLNWSLDYVNRFGGL